MKICDCTLRDGGYYTNWDFSNNLVVQYLKALNKIEAIKFIELGYRSAPQEIYLGEYFYCPDYVLKNAKIYAPNKSFVIMLNSKSTSLEDLDYLLKPCIGIVDLVRVAVNPSQMAHSIELSQAIKKMGFKVAFNIMYMSQWSTDSNFLSSLSKLDGFVDIIYLVDSYGSVLPDDVESAVKNIRNNTSIRLGFHGHNNLEMALINSIKAFECGVEFIDTTITGMGRGAGNLKTELLLTYLSKSTEEPIRLGSLTEVISQFENLQNSYKWGTNLPYMISGAFSLPQAEVMEWLSKKRYATSEIVSTLQAKSRKRTLLELHQFGKNILKNTYSSIVVIGGGQSVNESILALNQILKNNNILPIFAGFRNYSKISLEREHLVTISGQEFIKCTELCSNVQFISEASPRKMELYLPGQFHDSSFELPNSHFSHKDSLLSIALSIAIELCIKEVFLIGFDGYPNQGHNIISKENQTIIDECVQESLLSISSLKPTLYNNIPVKSIFSIVSESNKDENNSISSMS